MINPTVKLASIAVGVGGIVTGTGVGIYQMTQSKQEDKKDKSIPTDTPKPEKQSMEIFLTKAKLALLGEATGDSEIWTQKWNAFKQEYKDNEPSGAWNIEEWNTKKNNEDGLAKFKELCGTNSKVQVENERDPLYVAVSKHCTKPIVSSSTSLSPAG